MELLEGGNILDRIISENAISEAKTIKIMKQLLTAVAFCHSNNVNHGDLKPENVLYTNSADNIKITDFGCAQVLNKKKQQEMSIDTVMYFSPELLSNEYTEKSDEWSCGVLMYIMLCGHYPFGGKTREEIIHNITKAKFNFTPIIWGKISPLAKELIVKLLNPKYHERITATLALRDPWFSIKENVALDASICNDAITHLIALKVQNAIRKLICYYAVNSASIETDKQELIRMYTKIDTEMKGKLSQEELTNVLIQYYGPTILKEELEAMIMKHTSDVMQPISYIEFAASVMELNANKNEMLLKEAYGMLDKVME